MHWVTLPESDAKRQPAFQDAASAKLWLASQPQAQPLLMQALLSDQIGAIDAAELPPAQAVELLNLLHSAAVPVLASLEVRYTRKALPMLEEEQRVFAASQKLWTRLGIAYLRRTPHFAPRDKHLPLHRAANAFRLAELCHFMAGQECPAQLDELLFAVLLQAESSGILRQPLTDPDYPSLREANIAGLLAWALLLRLIDPYRLTAAQLTVANRALSRWRELCNFHAEADSSAKALEIPLAARFSCALPAGLPYSLGVRSVSRKIRGRIEALRAGETPEALKLGRELSTTACIRLLTDIDMRLAAQPAPASDENGEITLVFGAEHAYSIFTEELLNPDAGMDVLSTTLSNQRMAVFGFDQVSRVQTAVQKLEIPGEKWTLVAGLATRQPADGPRRVAPCLVAANLAGQPKLGILRGLRATADGTLKAHLDWYGGSVQACYLKQLGLREHKQARIAVFLLRDNGQISLVLPNNAPIRPGSGLALDGSSVEHMVPLEVIDRGIDFVRYSCRPG